jgi:CRP/FNR family transcriptional regulator
MLPWLDLYPSLSGLPRPLQDDLDRLSPVEAPAGTVLFEDGSACAAFPLLLAGEVRVGKLAANGRTLHLYSVLPGESCVITQGCLLGRQHYHARGVAHSGVRLLPMGAALFERLVAEHEPFRRFVFALFAERMSELMMLVDEVAFQRLDQRLARLLLQRGPRLRTTHQALADDLGSVREIVTRILRHFAHDGLVELGRESIEVLDPIGLARIEGAM